MNQVQSASPTTPAPRKQRDYIILDGSSSMQGVKWNEIQVAIDQYVKTLAELGTESDIRFCVFSSEGIDMLVYDGPIAGWQPLQANMLQCPGGGTPLYDAINHAGLTARNEDPTVGSFCFATDGDENGSVVPLAQAKAVIEWAKAKGWQITFLGCDFNNSQVMKELGLDPSEGVGVQRALLKDAMSELARKRHVHGLTGAPMHWSAEEQKQFGGYLSSSNGN